MIPTILLRAVASVGDAITLFAMTMSPCTLTWSLSPYFERFGDEGFNGSFIIKP
jgi:hypothetical protein